MAQQSSTTTTTTTTKSIDVGGVFLMDLSVNEAPEPSDACELSMAGPFEGSHHRINTHNHRAQPANGGHHPQQIYDTTNKPPTSHNPLLCRASQQQPHPLSHSHAHHHQDKSIRLSPTAYKQYNNSSSSSSINRRAPPPPPPREGIQQRQQQQPAAAAAVSSLEGLASVINCDRQLGRSTTATRRYEVAEDFRDDDDEEGDPLSSLSDESYLPTSSGTSLSASLTGSSELDVDSYGAGADDGRELDDSATDRDKESTTTREDSGVLDMKDLGGEAGQPQTGGDTQQQQQVPRSLERDQQRQRLESPRAKPGQEKSISANIMATNLINKTANGNTNMNFHHQAATANSINYNKQPQPQQQQQQQQQHRSISKPTDGSNNHQTHNTHNHQHQHQHHQTVTSQQTRSNVRDISTPRRSTVSASLPIQVPARQMKQNLNRMKLKLKLMKDSDEEVALANGDEQVATQQQQVTDLEREDDLGASSSSSSSSPPPIVRRGDRNRPALENIVAFCGQDDDAFLDQEFNANHHNHYPIDELDSEHLTAGEDPMRLFASIQALAKSLHEDAELFGSLPPKRMLESPIRSLALA